MGTNIYQPKPSTLKLNARSGDVGMNSAIYMNTNESLQITAISSIGANNPPAGFIGVTCSVDLRMLTTANGLVYQSFSFVPTSDYAVNRFEIKVPEGFLLNVSVYSTGMTNAGLYVSPQTPLTGQMWVAIALVATAEPNQFTSTYLAQGYITNQQRIAYPSRLPLSYADGYPFMRFGVGSPIGQVYQIPQHAVNEITGVSFTVVTGALTGPRLVYIGYNSATPPNQRVLTIPFGAAQNPSSTVFYTAYIGCPPQSDQVGTFTALPNRYRLKQGDFVNGNINGPGGDGYTNLVVWGNEWLVP